MRFLERIGVPPRLAVSLAVAVPSLTAATTLLLPLCLGVWLPDLWSGPKTLAEARTSSGNRFRVVQAWGSDFYTTELVQTLPDGSKRRGLLDGDDHKRWHTDLALDDERRHVTVDGATSRWPPEGGEDLRLQTPDGPVLPGLRSALP